MFMEPTPALQRADEVAEVATDAGGRQRILIARAVYKNPDYIFLDEATNSLDANNERAIVENLDTFYRGKTVVIVAHRLSTVRNAGLIVVLFPSLGPMFSWLQMPKMSYAINKNLINR